MIKSNLMYTEKVLRGFDETPIYSIAKRDVRDKAALLILHGLHDHCDRYENIADYFNNCGFSTVRYDMRGFGRSGGLRGYVDRFENYVLDLDVVVDYYIRGSEIPCYLFAHSMGALISAHHILRHGNLFRGVIFSGGLFKVNEDISPLLQKLSGMMSKLLPKLQTIKIDPRGLSRDPSVAQKIPYDKLHYSGGIRARTGREVMKATAEIQCELGKLDFPMLILHGGADYLTKSEASELLFSKSRSVDKTLKVYPGAYHELINDINKKEVLDDVHDWIAGRLPND